MGFVLSLWCNVSSKVSLMPIRVFHESIAIRFVPYCQARGRDDLMVFVSMTRWGFTKNRIVKERLRFTVLHPYSF